MATARSNFTTSRTNFTTRFLNNLKPPRTGRTIIWDATTRGLGIRVQETGTKTFFWARNVRGKLTWHTIGSVEDFTLEEARSRADAINSDVGKWKEAGSVGAMPIAKAKKALTLGALFDDYLTFHVAKAKNPVKALENSKWFFEAYLTTLRLRELSSITRAELRELHAGLGEKHGPVAANRAMQLVKRVINWGIDTERYEGGNVASKIQMFPEYSRERVAQKTELARLFAELDEEREPSRDLRDFVWLGLLTGARKGDILSMKWSDLALADNRWTIPSTTKSGRPYEVALPPRAVEILEERARRQKNGDSPEWVFPSRSVSGHLVDLKGAWKKLLERAQIKNLRQHDLRRTLASFQLKNGATMPVIGKTLGHAAGSSATAIYARPDFELMEKSVRAATNAMIALAPTKNL
jgi:integrase